MRSSYPYLLMMIGFIFMACSTSESATEDLMGKVNGKSYFPLQKNNYWVYENEAADITKDSVWVANDTLVEGRILYKLESESPTSSPFFTDFISNSLLTQDKNKLLLNGSINGLFGELEIPLDDVVLIDTDGIVNGQLYEQSGVSTLEKDNYTLQFNYTIASFTNNFYEEYALFDKLYQNVISTSFSIKMSGVVNSFKDGFEMSTPILKNQEVIHTTLYFAPGYGLIYNENYIDYQLTNMELLNHSFPFPAHEELISTQRIRDHSIKSY